MANKDMARVVIQLETEVSRLKRDFDKVEGIVTGANDNMVRSTRKAARAMERDMESAASKIGGSFKKATAGAVAAIGAGLSLNELRKAADEYKRILNILTVAGVSDAQRGGVLDALTKSAQANAVPLEALAQLYGRVSQAQTTLNTSSGELLKFTDLVSQALRVGGTSASEASGALLQLGQALSNGKVQSEEYNSMLEGAYPLLQAVAAGLKESGGDVAKLTALVKDGKVSSEAFYRAGLAGSQVLEQKLAGAVTTTDQAMQRLRNEFTLAVGKFDEAVGLTPALVAGLNNVAGSMAGIGSAATSAVQGVQALLTKVTELYEKNGAVLRQQGLDYKAERRAMRDKAYGMMPGGGETDTVASARAAANAKAAEDNRKALTGFRQSEIDFANKLQTAPLPPSRPGGANGIKPVSLADFKVPGSDDKGGGSSSKEKLDAYERELIQIDKRTKALQLEAAMTGKSTFEKEKAKAVLDLETAARKANLEVTTEMRAAIDKAATGYANAAVKVEEVKKALEDAQEAQKFFGDAITDSLGDLILNGEKAQDVMKALVKTLAKAALQAALMGSGPLAGIFGTAGTGGNVGGLFGTLFKGFDTGGYTGAGGKYEPKGVVHGGEYVFSKKAVQKIGLGNLEAMHRGYADGGPVAMPRSLPSVPRGVNSGGSSAPKIIIQNTQAQNVQAEAKQDNNGDIRVLISAVEAHLADNVLRGRGGLSAALSAKQTNRHMRG